MLHRGEGFSSVAANAPWPLIYSGMSRRLPIFALDVVLFPGAPLPLHIFESRYRQMIIDCLAGDERFGIVVTGPDGPVAASAGRLMAPLRHPP